MLVPSMTTEEVLREVAKDYQSYANNRIMHLCNDYHKARKKRNIGSKLIYPKIYNRVSPRKNKWLFLINKSDAIRLYKNTSHLSFSAFTYYYNKASFRVMKVMPDARGAGIRGVAFYNGHLFKRYAERTGKDFNQPIETVKEFFVSNRGNIGQVIPKHDTHYVISVCKEGLLLGVIPDQQKGYIIYNTFINKNQRYQEQIEIEDDLMNNLQEEIELLLKQETFDLDEKMRFKFRAGLLKSIKAD